MWPERAQTFQAEAPRPHTVHYTYTGNYREYTASNKLFRPLLLYYGKPCPLRNLARTGTVEEFMFATTLGSALSWGSCGENAAFQLTFAAVFSSSRIRGSCWAPFDAREMTHFAFLDPAPSLLARLAPPPGCGTWHPHLLPLLPEHGPWGRVLYSAMARIRSSAVKWHLCTRCMLLLPLATGCNKLQTSTALLPVAKSATLLVQPVSCKCMAADIGRQHAPRVQL